MTTATIKEKVLNMEAELEAVKKALINEPDFTVDEKVWKVVKPIAKKVSKKLYAKQYGKA